MRFITSAKTKANRDCASKMNKGDVPKPKARGDGCAFFHQARIESTLCVPLPLPLRMNSHCKEASGVHFAFGRNELSQTPWASYPTRLHKKHAIVFSPPFDSASLQRPTKADTKPANGTHTRYALPSLSPCAVAHGKET